MLTKWFEKCQSLFMFLLCGAKTSTKTTRPVLFKFTKICISGQNARIHAQLILNNIKSNPFWEIIYTVSKSLVNLQILGCGFLIIF